MTIFKKTGANTIYNLFGISALILLALLISFLLPKNILIPMSVIGLYISFYIIYKIQFRLTKSKAKIGDFFCRCGGVCVGERASLPSTSKKKKKTCPSDNGVAQKVQLVS